MSILIKQAIIRGLPEMLNISDRHSTEQTNHQQIVYPTKVPSHYLITSRLYVKEKERNSIDS